MATKRKLLLAQLLYNPGCKILNMFDDKEMSRAFCHQSFTYVMASMRKLKVLCLHGYRQDAETFKDKTGGFRKSLKNIADLVFISAPLKIPEFESTENILNSNSGKVGNSWWFCGETDDFNAKTPCKSAKGFEESVEIVKNAFQTQGPFDGILGFSQGASLVSLICGLKEHQGFPYDFQFVVLISGFRSISECHQYLYEKPFHIKSLHIIGKNDTCIPKELGEDLIRVFQEPSVVYHDGGHYVPTHSSVRQEYVSFFKQMLNLIANKD